MASGQPRRPQSKYKDQNGFKTEHVALEGNAAVEAQDFAHFVLKEMGSGIPSLSEMKSIADAPETSINYKDEIELLKKRQEQIERTLHTLHGENLRDDALDAYFQTDDLKYFDELSKGDEWSEHYHRLDKFYKFSAHCQATDFYDALEASRYAYIEQLVKLQRSRVDVERREEDARVRKEAQFPETVLEYKTMDSKPAQLRIARFLMANEDMRERMRTESRWAWRQTQPLISEYKTNAGFRDEVQLLVKANASTDPRSRQV